MAEDADEKTSDRTDDGSKRPTREEYDRLVRGVDDIFFGGLDEPTVVKPPPEKSDDEKPKDE